MASLNNSYPPDWKGRPPQMPANDAAVWREFIARRGNEWRSFAYDVELHGGDTPIVGTEPELQRAWARAIAKRADVIAERASGHTIIEVRKHARYATLGQLQVYRRLFPADYPHAPLEAALIVCDTIDPDVRQMAESLGLQVWTTSD